ncbi:MAG: FAD-binding oxidoreductase [Actinomycetes bacterium]
MQRYDVLVVGGGISGVSVAYELAADRSVGLIDMESVLAFHTSGRSLATFLESYGGPVIRALTTGSRAALENPPDIMEPPLLSPLGLLWLGPQGQSNLIHGLHDAVRDLVPDVQIVSGSEAEEINPALAKGYTEIGMFEPGATSIDVNALHQGYVKGVRRLGGEVRVSTKLVSAERKGSIWRVKDSAGNEYEAETIVNAAGSWVDEVAEICGAKPVGIRPLRRTVFLVSAPADLSLQGIPLTGNIENTWYFMPQGEFFACSPADETLMEPCDAKPDPLEIARALEAINEATILKARSIKSPWAGLRNFVPDGVPVVGYDEVAEGFFWYAGQGGYGMQIAPALSKTAVALIDGLPIPEDLVARGLKAEDISASRPGMSHSAGH